MKPYIISLLCVCIASAFSLYLLSGSFASPAVKMLCSLCVLLSIVKVLSPLFNTITDVAFEVFDEKQETTSSEYNDEIINGTGRYICNYTKQMLTSRYPLNASDFIVTVKLDVDDELNAALKEVIIEFSSEPSVSTAMVADYIENVFLCKCVIITP